MAVKRIDLSLEIQDWQHAGCGEEVRGASISSLRKTEAVINGTVDDVNQAAADVKLAVTTANNAVTRANQAIDHADDILANATAQAKSSASSAENAQSWAVGGTGIRTGEDSDNSRFYSLESKSEADRAKQAADKAEHYAGFIVPDFIIDFVTGELRYTDTNDIVFVINVANGTLDYSLV